MQMFQIRLHHIITTLSTNLVWVLSIVAIGSNLLVPPGKIACCKNAKKGK